MRSYLFLFPLIYAFQCVWAQGTFAQRKTPPVFGTENGYDNGGIDPVCWSSQVFNTSDRDDTQSTIEYLNDKLFNGTSGLELLPKCFNGTSLLVEPLDLGPDRVFLKEEDYTFRITMEANLTNVNKDIQLGENSTIFIRLIMCDAIRVGFCSPFDAMRASDSSLRPGDSDLNGNPTGEFDTGDDKWRYKEGNALLGIEQDTFIVSRWVKWTLKKSKNFKDVYRTTVDITLRLKSNVRSAPYFFIAHAVMSFGVGANLLERVDVADAVPDNVLEVRNPPNVRDVSQAMKISLGLASGIFGSVALFMLAYIVRHRKHMVMQLAQWPFLAAIAGWCLIAIAFAFTAMPTRELFCQLGGPMVICPITIIGAILVGRMWRVYRTLSGALGLGRGKKKKRYIRCGFGAGVVDILTCLAYAPFSSFRKKDDAKLRTVVTAQETLSLIVILSFPQVFLQVFGSIYYRQELRIQYDSAAEVGRYTCESESNWVGMTGLGIAAAMYLLAVTVAWVARKLPSAFNEKDQVFQAAAFNTTLSLIVIALLEVLDKPTTPPDVLVFLRALFAIGISMIVLVIMVLPKIRRVISGEKVVLTNLLANRVRIGTESSQLAYPTESQATFAPAGRQYQDRIIVKKDDPLPRSIETQVFEIQGLLSEIDSRCQEGRTVDLELWKKLQRDIARFKMELDKVELEWDGETADNKAADDKVAGDEAPAPAAEF